MHFVGAEPFPDFYVDGKDDSKYQPVAKSQYKKIHKLWERDMRKQAEVSLREQGDAEKREKNLEEARKIVIEEDKSLPEAERIKISEGMFFANSLLLYFIHCFDASCYLGNYFGIYSFF